MHKKSCKKFILPLPALLFSIQNSILSLTSLLKRPALHIAILVLFPLFYSACAERNVLLIKKPYDVVYEKKEEVPVTYRAKQYEVNSEDITAIESTAGAKSYNPAGLEHYNYLLPDNSRYNSTGHSSEGAVK